MKHYITILLKLFAGVLTTAAFIALLFGGFRFVETQGDIVVGQEQLIKDMATVKEQVLVIDANVKQLNNGQDDLAKSQNALRNSFLQYLANDKALSKEDFFNYVKGVGDEEKKKSGTSSSWTPLMLQNTEIQQD